MSREPIAYPWEWLESITSVGCPMCGLPSRPLRPSRRRKLTCRGCRTRYNSFTARVVQPGQPPVVLRSIAQVVREARAGVEADRPEPARWQEARASLGLLLERTDDPLPICRSLLDHGASDPAAVAGRLAEAAEEVRAAIDRRP